MQNFRSNILVRAKAFVQIFVYGKKEFFKRVGFGAKLLFKYFFDSWFKRLSPNQKICFKKRFFIQMFFVGLKSKSPHIRLKILEQFMGNFVIQCVNMAGAMLVQMWEHECYWFHFLSLQSWVYFSLRLF